MNMLFVQGWKAFFEEPIMLIAFVLLGRNLEQRAKIKATSDMTGLLSILPAKARLFINGDSEEFSSTVEVPCNNLSVGDQIVVLPGVSKMYTFYVFIYFSFSILLCVLSSSFDLLFLVFSCIERL